MIWLKIMDGGHQSVLGDKKFGEFVVDAHSPDTIPMSRLAEYLATLAIILGEDEEVHFEKVEPGSLKIKYWTREDRLSSILERQRAVSEGTAEKAVMSAYARMNDLLEKDQAVGALNLDGQILPFPGRAREHAQIYGPIDDDLSVEGQLVRIGGKDKTIHATIQDGAAFHNCSMSRTLAKDMCHYLFGPEIRVSGRAKWQRNRDAEWVLLGFVAERFEELEDAELDVLVAQLRKTEGNAWKEMSDPLKFAADLRGGHEE